ncbi:MAG: hypothetical protein MI919_08485 [Holophagales bacterium]|nr:hypothetical protein [Holophagales bacterium]
MRRILSFAFASLVLVAFFAAPASACPPCSNYEMWTATPCLTTNCSSCGYCSYCCFRWGIGCENCLQAASEDVACDDLLATPAGIGADLGDGEVPASSEDTSSEKAATDRPADDAGAATEATGAD